MQKKSLIKNRQAVKKAILASRTSAPAEPGSTKVAPSAAIKYAGLKAAPHKMAAMKHAAIKAAALKAAAIKAAALKV